MTIAYGSNRVVSFSADTCTTKFWDTVENQRVLSQSNSVQTMHLGIQGFILPSALTRKVNRVFVLFCKFELLNRIRMHFFLLNQESSPVFYAKFLSAAKYFGLTPHCVEFCDADMSLQSARVLKSSFLLRCTRKTNILIWYVFSSSTESFFVVIACAIHNCRISIKNMSLHAGHVWINSTFAVL